MHWYSLAGTVFNHVNKIAMKVTNYGCLLQYELMIIIVTPPAAISHVIADLWLWLHRFKNPRPKDDAMILRDHFSACNSEP
jgi:hypothetical protein